MTQPWKVILVLIGIFVAGGVTGGFVALQVGKNHLLSRPVPEEWAPKIMKRLNDSVELTPAQHEQIRPIVHRNMELLNRIRNSSMAETKAVVENMQREISERLTPEQRIKYEQLNRELREQRDARDKVEREKRKNLDRPSGEKPATDKPPGDKPAAENPPGK